MEVGSDVEKSRLMALRNANLGFEGDEACVDIYEERLIVALSDEVFPFDLVETLLDIGIVELFVKRVLKIDE
jgi:hypothetical protein